MKLISFICLLFIASLLVGNSFSKESIKADEITCNMCNAIVGFAEQYVIKNTTEQEIVKKVDDFCGILPSEFSQSCVETVNNYGVLIIRLLINKEDADNICIMIELCSKSSSSEINNYMTQVDDIINSQASPDQICSDLELCDPSSQTIKLTSETEVFGGMFCQTCKDMIGPLIGMGASSVMNTLKEEAQNFCNKFPFISGYCYNYIMNEAQQIITYLNENQGPNQICQELNFCAASSSASALSSSLFLDQENNNGTDCEICSFITKYAENLLEANKTMGDIEKVVDDFCKMIPSQYTADCIAMASNYIPNIIKMLENNYNPEQICQELGLCSPPPTNTPSPQVIPLSTEEEQ
ncbi:hypothetical protein ACTFIV_003844 [Dictyostelium citrinum]